MSQPAGGNKARNPSSSSFQPISIHTSSPFEDSFSGPLSAPGTLQHHWNNRPGSSSAGSNSNGSFAFSPRDSLYASPTGLSFRDSFESSLKSASKCETITSPEHLNVTDDISANNATDPPATIPVGIAVARQREQRDASPFAKPDLEVILPQTPNKLSLDPFSRPPPAHHHHPMSPWPSLPFATEAFSHQPAAALAAGLPLGYQLAKDPLTGQVFFVPGSPFAAAYPHLSQLLWPQPGPNMPPPPPPPPPISPTPFHQSLLSLQETWMARQQFFYGNSHSPLAQLAAAASAAATPPPAHQRSSEPMTSLRVPSTAAVASLISSENEMLRRPPRVIKEERQDQEVKHRNFLVDSLCRASNSSDSNVGVASEASDDRISVGSLNDDLRYHLAAAKPAEQSSHDHVIIVEAVKSERKDSCDSIVAINESDDDIAEQNGRQKLAGSDEKPEEPRSGLDLLNEGIERLERLSDAGMPRPRLSSTPPRGARHMSVDAPRSSGGLRLLCDVALMSDVEEEERKSPKARSRSLDSQMLSNPAGHRADKRNYSSPKAEQNAKAFIASKSLRVADVIPLDLDSDLNSTPSWKMESWEENVRQNIANIQRKYKEKYKELYKLQHLSAKKQKVRRPSEASPAKKLVIKTEPTPAAEDQRPKDKESSSVWLKKSKRSDDISHHTVTSSTPVRWEIKNKQDLSDITSKFKSSRPNPFENLLRLSAHKSSPKLEPIFTSTPKISSATLVGSVTSVCATSPGSNSSVDVTNATEKSRHSSPPRKLHHHHHHHSRRVVETLVIKKPKEEPKPVENGVKGSSPAEIPKLLEFDNVSSLNPNDDGVTLSPPVLEPMTETKLPLTFKISKKELDDDELEALTVKRVKKAKKNKKDKKEKKLKKMKVVVDDEESCDAITDKSASSTSSSHHHKRKKSKKSRENSRQGQQPFFSISS